MDWFVINAVDKAIARTKKCLMGPFEFWKWFRLTMIIMLLGTTGFNTGGSSGLFDNKGEGFGDTTTGPLASIAYAKDSLISSIDSDPALIAAVIGTLLIMLLLFVLFMSILSSIMEFVLIRSLVSNDVRIWDYTRRYFSKGARLFLFRILVNLIIVAIAATFIVLILIMTGGFVALTGNILSFMAVAIVPILIMLMIIALLSSIVNSFIGLAIPISMYSGKGITNAFSIVWRKFIQDPWQILIYWAGRAVLQIALGIVVTFASLLVIFTIVLVSVMIDVTIFLLLKIIAVGAVYILIPLIIIQLTLLILAIAFVGMPAKVFLSYHMLTFMQLWYPDTRIPMFDEQNGTEMNIDTGML